MWLPGSWAAKSRRLPRQIGVERDLFGDGGSSPQLHSSRCTVPFAFGTADPIPEQAHITSARYANDPAGTSFD